MTATAAVCETGTIARYIDTNDLKRIKLTFLGGTLGVIDAPLWTRKDLRKGSDGFFGIRPQALTGRFVKVSSVLFNEHGFAVPLLAPHQRRRRLGPRNACENAPTY